MSTQENNVYSVPHFMREVGDRFSSGDGGGGTIDGMEDRLRANELAVAKIEALLPTLATKADLAEGFAGMVKWIVGSILAAAAAGITVMTFVLNNATPKPSAPPQPPVILIAPSAVAPVPLAPQAPASR